MESTNRLALPLLSPGQSQKEIVHNEALQRLDTLVNATVEEPPLTEPLASVSQGQSFIVGSGMQVVGPRQNAIPNPTGGTAVDSEARLAIAAILDALRAHGLVAE